MTGTQQDFASEFTIEQEWQGYSAEEHAIWRLLFERQQRLLVGRACREYLEGLGGLGVEADGIPNFRRLSDVLDAATGWRIVACPGSSGRCVLCISPADGSHRPASFAGVTSSIIFKSPTCSDICGHVPLLMNPVFADYMQAYGEGGLKAQGLGHLQHLARLYWYTVEFGLIATPEGCASMAPGSSPPQESRYHSKTRGQIGSVSNCDGHAHPLPHRHLQETYFVIDDFQQLFDATRPDFAPIYPDIAALPDIRPTLIDETANSL